MRIIPRIDIKNDYAIKGINLEGNRKIGFQFHPEKSGEIGVELLRETIKYF